MKTLAVPINARQSALPASVLVPGEECRGEPSPFPNELVPVTLRVCRHVTCCSWGVQQVLKCLALSTAEPQSLSPLSTSLRHTRPFALKPYN